MFGKTVSNIKRVYEFSLQLLSETFFILKENHRDIITNVRRSSCKVPIYSCGILMGLEFYQKILEKSSSTMFHVNPYSGSRDVSCRWTGRQHMTKLRIAFRYFVKAPEKCHCAYGSNNSYG